ncbi:hypothetical protein DFR74_102928 [Nocardia puris]|uniref:Uncharacterized protein n=1 Tax=Nocardia puris TaxID=208602 RepID=A0A366DXA3_9NOCA|nr:hypothetical protein DFR74_102928 [Nocardia puris]
MQFEPDPADRTSSVSDMDTFVVHWPDPSPLESWWAAVMRGAVPGRRGSAPEGAPAGMKALAAVPDHATSAGGTPLRRDMVPHPSAADPKPPRRRAS